ncbi:hypothetical protein [Neobacillus niacini]|uniref:hypothetical protein n=1 Tax=Neobacillus niacini TaxID=86668 RepID=UPI0028604860|nr:hypothetical protein [Neobacillus niacini]MDR7001103.1 hypothetical protein [Neobacillus niacini]
MNDNSFFLLALAVWPILIFSLVYKIFKLINIKIAILSGSIFNICLFFGISYLWFYLIAIDGVSQVIGIFFFIGYFLLMEIILLIFLLIKKSKDK